MRKIERQLEALRACEPALEWVRKTPGGLPQLWAKCKDPAWLFWLAGKAQVPHAQIILAACACARTALKYVPAGEERPRLAIEAAEGFVAGTHTLEQVNAAASAAARASYTAASDAASTAALADAESALAAACAASSACVAADAAGTAAAANAARKKCCALIREHITAAMVARGLP